MTGLIIHSDGGGQYYSNEFRKLTKEAEMVNSMGKTAYENPHAERVNGIIKNNYIRHYGPKSFINLIKMTNKAVQLYNTEKPHRALNKLSPIQFENMINDKSNRCKTTNELTNEKITFTYNRLINSSKVVSTI